MTILGKKKITATLLIILILAMTGFTGCGNNGSEGNSGGTDPDTGGNTTSEAAADQTPSGDLAVKISIDFPDDSDMDDVKDVGLAVPADATALDLLFAYINDVGIEMETEGDDDPYVSKIGTVKEDDSSGWVFTINDKTIMKSSGKAVLKNGDHVKWEYTTWQE